MLDQERMPRHVAIIMDGNGRWAKNRGLPRLAGHNAGMKAMKKIVDHSDKLGIRYLTVYAFSTENWKRSLAEVSGIFKLLVTYVNSDLKGLIENNVKVQVLGDYSTLPKDAVKSLEKTLEETKNNTGLQFNIALNYGGRDEIVRAARAYAKEYKDTGKKKIMMIYELTDETYSLVATSEPPEGVDAGWFYFFISMLDHSYWIIGCKYRHC